MTSKKPANGYTRQDWDEVSDNPEWTAEDIRNAKPFADVFPELADSIKRARMSEILEKAIDDH